MRDPRDIRMRLRFLISQCTDDVLRAAQAVRAKADALRDAGASEAAVISAEKEAGEWQRCGMANCQVLANLVAAAEFTTLEGVVRPDDGAAMYDDACQALRGLARDWTDAGAAVRSQSLGLVVQRLVDYLGSNAEALRILVPGCGLGRLALEVACKLGCHVVANDESAMMIGTLAGLLQRGRVSFFPGLTASAPDSSPGVTGRCREAEAVVTDDLAASASRVLLEHRDFCDAGRPEAEFEAVATLFVLDAVASLPAAVAAVSRALRPGGVWVNCGPLRKHRELRLFTFADVTALAEANGMSVLEDTCFGDCEYLPREAVLGLREVYEVQLLVARKRGCM